MVAIGRIDPLKDVHTMLRVAVEVLERVPHAQFLYYGPSSPEQEAYAKSCKDLHRQLGLDERFKFMGSTRDVTGALQAADMLLMTSISEGLPMGILEALAQGRPVVATSVGGVPEVLRGCGIVAPPCDVHGIAVATTTILTRSGPRRPPRQARPPARRAQVHQGDLPRRLPRPVYTHDDARGGAVRRLDPRRAAPSSRPASAGRCRTASRPPWCSRPGADCRPATRSTRGRKLIGHVSGPAPRAAVTSRSRRPSGRSATAEGISLVLAILAVAMWASPLSSMLGAAVWDTAVRIALPLTFALQWIMWSRHLSKGEGLGSMRREGPVGIVGLAAIAATAGVARRSAVRSRRCCS